MTEVEWMAATDPMPMLEFLQGKASDRKLRLFAVACIPTIQCQYRNLHLSQKEAEMLASEKREVAVRLELAEKFADNHLGVEEMRRYWVVPEGQFSWPERPWEWVEEITNSKNAWVTIADTDISICMFREIFGNPFCPATIDPSWLSSTVLALAAGIYADKAFDRLPILADAVQDAGCDHEDLLNHLRSPGPHYKGCWALDLVLGGKCQYIPNGGGPIHPERGRAKSPFR